MNLLQLEHLEKRNGFRDFLLKRNPSESFAAKYMTYLTCSLVRSYTKNISGCDSIYEVENLTQLNEIYQRVKADKNNIRLHNIYSGVVSAYIKYITGNELRKRVIPSNEDKHSTSYQD